MMDALERAKTGLQIEDVFQQRAEAWLDDDFDPKFDSRVESCSIRYKHIVAQSMTLINEQPDEPLLLFRVQLELGAQLIVGDDEGSETLAQIEATYIAEYRVDTEELLADQDALDAFALKNASYHVWPYWREYLSSQSQRMNLPKIILPTMQLARNSLQ